MENKKVEVNERVRRINNGGCEGIVKELREEVTVTNQEVREAGKMAYVLWDNGTYSCLAPEALEAVSK